MSGHSTQVQSLAQQILDLSKSNDKNGAREEILMKAQALVAAVSTPRDHSMALTWPIVQGSAIRTLLHLGALQAIPTSGSISLKDLAFATGAQASLLQRLLRVLAGADFITQHADGSYSHTPLSSAYATDQDHTGILFKTIFDEVAVLMALPTYLQTHGTKEPDGEQATTHNPNTWYHGQEGKTVFEIMENDAEKLKGFQTLMAMAARFRPFTGFYDFSKLNTTEQGRPVLVDVGGADGTTIVKILEAHPDIRAEQCVLEDLPRSIELGRKNSSLPQGVQFQAHDFFQPQPVKNAKAYLLRAVCHDWSDTSVIKILSNIASAMSIDSKLLIADNVLPEGAVKGMAAYMDLMMLCIGGKERTKSNFEEVLDAAGLKLDEIYLAGHETGFAIVEASLK